MISVLMLTYNREELVSWAIESILNQTYRVRVIHRERGNIGAGRNTGLDAARGEYIAFLDDDDWVEPDFLEFLLGLAQDSQADVGICGTQDKTFDEKKVMAAEEAMIELLWRKKFNVGFPTKLIRQELFHNCRFSETSRFDDIYLTMGCPNIMWCGMRGTIPLGLLTMR